MKQLIQRCDTRPFEVSNDDQCNDSYDSKPAEKTASRGHLLSVALTHGARRRGLPRGLAEGGFGGRGPLEQTVCLQGAGGQRGKLVAD